MTANKKRSQEFIKYHNDGSIWANGKMMDGQADGYWDFFRKNGIIMRSGYFSTGVQVGEWTTYDGDGKIYKVTKMKAKSK